MRTHTSSGRILTSALRSERSLHSMRPAPHDARAWAQVLSDRTGLVTVLAFGGKLAGGAAPTGAVGAKTAALARVAAQLGVSACGRVG